MIARTAVPPHRKAMPVILDTDMGNDIDDALALAMLHSLESQGECRLLGVTVCKDHPLAPRFVDLVNTFYRRGHLPIGMVRDGVTPEERTYLRPVVEAVTEQGEPRYPTSHREYPDAVVTLRRLLAAEADGSVVLVMIGFSTNLSRLLDSRGDAISPLDGRELVARKVREVVAMAANFSDAVQANLTLENREYNVHKDIASARQFIERCPAPILFSGFEIGESIPLPVTSIQRDYTWASHHPVVDAYRVYKPMPYDRPTWDQTAVLAAVRPDAGYFRMSATGRVTVCAEGTARFEPVAGGLHRYLILDAAQRERTLRDIVDLCARPVDGPGDSSQRGRRPRERAAVLATP